MTQTEYVLTEGVKGILLSRGKDLVCCVCGKALKAGDRVHRNANADRYYHKACFEKLRL